MKQINIVLLLLCLFAAGCKNDKEESLFHIIKTYPTETQIPFAVTDCKGILSYDNELQEQCITVSGTDVLDVYIVTKLPKELEGYEGAVRFSGEALYLYHMFKAHAYIETIPMDVHSLDWTEMGRVE